MNKMDKMYATERPTADNNSQPTKCNVWKSIFAWPLVYGKGVSAIGLYRANGGSSSWN